MNRTELQDVARRQYETAALEAENRRKAEPQDPKRSEDPQRS